MQLLFILCVLIHVLIGYTRFKAGLPLYGGSLIVIGIVSTTMDLNGISVQSAILGLTYVALFLKSHRVMVEHDLWRRVFRR